MALLLVGFVRLGVEKHVTLVVGGRPESISTRSWNVQQLLVGEGIELTSSVQVVPPPATELSNGMTVTVSPAPGAPTAVAGQISSGVGVWVMDGVSDTGVGSGALTEPSSSAMGIGPSPVVFARVVVSGTRHDVLTNASTAGELLAAMGIQPDANDRVHPSPRTPLHDGLSVRFDQVRVFTRQQHRLIPFPVRTTFSEQLAPGSVQVLRRGVPGLARTAARVVKVNGRLTSRHVLLDRVIRSPLAELLLSGPASAAGGTLGASPHIETGGATWYDPPWSGLTAAHPWLPFGTMVTVTDVATGRSVVVVINDRGPFAPDKIIDLSPEAFRILSPLARGVIDVRLTW
ncbi:MAG: ubiquitin-like domain-containing protein [Actinomycetota bacterium]|nr:ubiquitin-like domain-containing protein [Actinomycetota bacterium]